MYVKLSSDSLSLGDDLESQMLIPQPTQWVTIPYLYSAGIEHRALCMLDKCSLLTEPHP